MKLEELKLIERDEIVDEVRAIREAIDSEVGHDAVQLAERAHRATEEARKQFGFEIVSRVKRT